MAGTTPKTTIGPIHHHTPQPVSACSPQAMKASDGHDQAEQPQVALGVGPLCGGAVRDGRAGVQGSHAGTSRSVYKTIENVNRIWQGVPAVSGVAAIAMARSAGRHGGPVVGVGRRGGVA